MEAVEIKIIIRQPMSKASKQIHQRKKTVKQQITKKMTRETSVTKFRRRKINHVRCNSVTHTQTHIHSHLAYRHFSEPLAQCFSTHETNRPRQKSPQHLTVATAQIAYTHHISVYIFDRFIKWNSTCVRV